MRQRGKVALTSARPAGRNARILVGIAPSGRHFTALIDSLILSISPTGGSKAAMPNNHRAAAAAFFCFATLAGASLGAVTSAYAADPFGTWYTEGKTSQVRIVKCGNALCGALVWLKEPNDANGRPKTDKENTDAKLQNRPLLGVQIVLGMAPTGTPDQWKGKVYNAKDGNTYTGYFTMTSADSAELKGCALGFICKSQTWTRAKP
jgi:uncharacterized protein (DUF2147 family)